MAYLRENRGLTVACDLYITTRLGLHIALQRICIKQLLWTEQNQAGLCDAIIIVRI